LASGEEIDEVMAVLMRAPKSYTKEDVAEIHCHGGAFSAQAVLTAVLQAGAREAEPGEFTKRAFLNGRIDLARAEAVMQIIGANGISAARASLRQLEGGVSAFVRGVSQRLTSIMAHIEASNDFPEEIEEEAAAREVVSGIDEILAEIRKRLDERSARILREGASIVLAGRPNVGKSSLLNALLNQERAIVTEIPGTTRDVLTERINLGGVQAEISDTAGIRQTDDPVEKIGVSRAEQALNRADVVLLVLDASEILTNEDRRLISKADERYFICLNKNDLPPAENLEKFRQENIFFLSARTGAGVEKLIDAVRKRISAGDNDQQLLIAQRHIRRAREAADFLNAAKEAIVSGFPLDTASIDLKAALESLMQITGENATESVIDSVFKNFCVGK